MARDTWFIKLELAERDGWGCRYCGKVLNLHDTFYTNPNYATIDHVIATADGGLDQYDNMALSCSACNTAKGSIMASRPLKVQQKARFLQEKYGFATGYLSNRTVRRLAHSHLWARKVVTATTQLTRDVNHINKLIKKLTREMNHVPSLVGKVNES